MHTNNQTIILIILVDSLCLLYNESIINGDIHSDLHFLLLGDSHSHQLPSLQLPRSMVGQVN